MRDLSPRQQRHVATEIKKGLKETINDCTTMNSSQDKSTVPNLQMPLTPMAHTMQSPDINTSPTNCDVGKKSGEKQKEKDGKCMNKSTIVSMATSSDALSSNDTGHHAVSRQNSHNVVGSRHFDADPKRVPNSASYTHEKNSALFRFDEFGSEKLNCNSSNNCATKPTEDSLSPHIVGTPSQIVQDNSHMSRTPSTNSTLSPVSLPMDESVESKMQSGASSRTNQQSGLMENDLHIDDFDESELKDLTKLANNSNVDSLDTADIISDFSNDPQNPNAGSNRFLFSDPIDPAASIVSQVTTAATTSPTVTTVTTSLTNTTRTPKSTVSAVSSTSFPSPVSASATCGMSPSTQYSPLPPGKSSCLQNILGVTDTIKLKKLSQPVNSGHLPCPITTSFSPNALKSLSTHNQNTPLDTNTKLGSTQQKSPMFPSNMPYNNRHLRSPNLPFQTMKQGQGLKNQPTRPYNMYNDGSNTTNLNRNTPFLSRSDSHPYSPTTSGPNAWPQRGLSPSQSRSPPQFNTSGSIYNSTKINPMTGLQCTVDSILIDSVGSGSTTPTSVVSSNSMGPPLLSPGGTPPPGRMRTPSLTSSGDKRCVSADGMLPSGATGNNSRTKDRNKRERTKSADSKNEDDKRDTPGPKAKRKKSRSKEDGNKSFEGKPSSRPSTKNQQSTLNSLLDPKNTSSSHMYVYSSQIANKAAEDNIANGMSFLLYHRSFIGNQLLSPTQSIQSEGGLTDPTPKPNPLVSEATPASVGTPHSAQSDLPKQEEKFTNGDKTGPRGSLMSPNTSEFQRQSSQQTDESLTDEKRRQREEKLGKIQRLQHLLSNNFQPNSTEETIPEHPPPHMHSGPVRGPTPKDGGAMNANQQNWNNLLQEHNNEKMRQQLQPVRPPPPYQQGGHGRRWPNPDGFDMRMHEMSNPRFSRMPMQNPSRFPPEHMARMPGYQQRMRYSEPGARHPMYDQYNMPGNPSIPPNMMGPGTRPPGRGVAPRGSASENYPFSNKLARAANLYKQEPGFDPNPEPIIGPRMNSPEWNPGHFPNNMPGPESTHRLTHMSGGEAGPMRGAQMGPNPMIPTSVDQMMMSHDHIPPPGGTPVPHSMDHPHPGVRIPSSYEMGQPRMPYSNGDPSMNPMGSPPGPMHMPMHNHMAGPMPTSMNEAMARRGDQRPPDIPIPRSPSTYGMPQRFSHPSDMPSHGNPMGLMHPQQSPITPNMPRSPGSVMMKSPMQPQFAPMGPNMDSNMMGPHSAGPIPGQSSEWGLSGAPTPGSRTPNMVQMSRSQGQSALSVMMNSVNNYKMSSAPLYQEAIKDTPSSPLIPNPSEPTLSHEPPPLSHGPGMPAATSGMPSSGGMPRNMMRYHGNFPGPENPNQMSPQNMHPRNMIPPNVRGGSLTPGAMNANMPPGANNPNFPPQSYQNEPNFDIKQILPRKEPSETLSYYPQNQSAGEMMEQIQQPTNDSSQLNNHPQMSSMNTRYPPSMGHRPITPSAMPPYNHSMNPAERSPNCFPPMDNINYHPGMHSDQPQMMEGYNPNPGMNWPEGGHMGSGIRPQLMHGEPMYSATRP